VVICVDHLVGHGVLQVTLVLHLIGTQQNTKFGIEPTSLPTRAAATIDVMAVEITSKLADVVTEESDDGACADKGSVS
jgi:hypothetical protein